MKPKFTIFFICLSLALTACSPKEENADNQYSGHFGDHHFFETPKKIISRSGANFQAHGWLVHEITRKEKEIRVIRILCKWDSSVPLEERSYTPATVLVDGREPLPKSRLQHANIASHPIDDSKGLSPFILVQENIPAEWNQLEVHFQGSTPSTLEIQNI